MKKTNNKGFSLVELIIVIAIMAILIGVLAPQYIKYVEKSRVSADKDVLDSIYNAYTTAASDPDVDPTTIVTATATFQSLTVTAANSDRDFGAVVMDTLGQGYGGDPQSVEAKLKSEIARNNSRQVQISVDANNNYTVFVGTQNDPENGITVGAGAED